MTDVSVILRELPRLDHAALQRVRAQTTALLSLEGGALSPSVEDAPAYDYLTEGIFHELRRRGVLGIKDRVPERHWPPDYKRLSGLARQNLEHHMPNLPAVEKTALGRLAARALSEYLAGGPVPIGPKVLMQNVHKVAVAIDASFPDYLTSGLLPCCWRNG